MNCLNLDLGGLEGLEGSLCVTGCRLPVTGNR